MFSRGGPGSCRSSEIYGASGAFPAFSDGAYAPFLDRKIAIVTHNVQGQAPNYVLTIFDIDGPPPPPNMNYAAPRYNDPSWTMETLGPIFGLTLDSEGNIYVAPTSVYYTTPPQPGMMSVHWMPLAPTTRAVLSMRLAPSEVGPSGRRPRVIGPGA